MTKEELKATIRCIHELWYGKDSWVTSPAHALKLHRHMEVLFNFAEIESTLVENNPDEISPHQFKIILGVTEE